LAERLRLARRWSTLSQKALATQVGVSASAAAQWETPAGTMPSVEHMARVAVATRISFEWLATGRGAPHAADLAQPAAVLGDFALDLDEERLLKIWRRLPRKAREPLLSLLEGVLPR
jgi:transcriptional regulator with XRE-family HTH domain